jgi:hypothetical protein
MIGALGTRESCYACTPRPANLYGHGVAFSVRTTRRLLPGKRYFDDSRRGGDGIRSRSLLVFNNDRTHRAKKPRNGSPDHLSISLSCDCGLATTQLLSGSRIATSHTRRTAATESQQ